MYASSIFEHAEDIIKDNMDREFAIRPAVNAHKRGEYALSVPIFFAQAEGILSKKREKYLFFGDDSKRIYSLAKEKLGDDSLETAGSFGGLEVLMARLKWTGLKEKPPISYSLSGRQFHGYFGLNRNMVLQGEVIQEYATEINSLKVFSLLGCISAITSVTQ